MDKKDREVVLVVDDSLLICRQVRTALEEREEIFVCEAHDGQQALEMVKQYQPDLILLDVILPDIEGYDLCSELKEEDSNNAVVIFLTAKDGEEDVQRGFTEGAIDYIKKPFVLSELRMRVLTHLSQKRQKDELDRMNKELTNAMKKLNTLAFRDGLTGLYNRRYVIGDLVDDIKGKEGEDRKNVLILADIDDFKRINDTYGHEAGDQALVCIANILEAICRKHKVVRWGGEEFLMILFGVTESEAYGISENIRQEVEKFEIFHSEGSFNCTLTLGLHNYQEAEGIEESINRADKALYYGKRNGKNQSVWFEKIGQAD